MHETIDTAVEPSSTARRKGPPRLRLLLYVFWFGLLAWLCGFLVIHSQQMRLLAQQGQTTQARVTSTRMYATRSPDYYVDYTFEAGGRPREGSDSVSKEMYRRTHTDDLLTITYLPADPTITCLGIVDPSHVEEGRQVGVGILGIT